MLKKRGIALSKSKSAIVHKKREIKSEKMATAGAKKILKKIKKLKVGDGMNVKEVNGPEKYCTSLAVLAMIRSVNRKNRGKRFPSSSII